MNYADEIPMPDDEPLGSRRAPSPLDSLTVAAYESERLVEAALRAFDPEGEIDIIANRFGSTWSVRPITGRATRVLTDWLDGDLPDPDPVFSAFCLPVAEDDIVPLLDALIDAGLRIG